MSAKCHTPILAIGPAIEWSKYLLETRGFLVKFKDERRLLNGGAAALLPLGFGVMMTSSLVDVRLSLALGRCTDFDVVSPAQET